MVLDVTENLFGIQHVPDVCGYTVSLHSVLTWAIIQTRLHGNDKDVLTFNIKLDGRPLAGEFSIYSYYPHFKNYATSTDKIHGVDRNRLPSIKQNLCIFSVLINKIVF